MRRRKPGLSVQLQQEQSERPVKISLLVNSIFYFIECVFIMTVDDGYRLLVLHQGHVLTDEVYQSSKGAKIAFQKIWRYKAWREDVRPQWTHFYSPESWWLEEKTAPSL